MAVDRDLAADPAVVEGKSAEMLRDQDDRIALAFVRTKGARRHHPVAFEAERQAIIVKSRDELAVAHRMAGDPHVVDGPLHHCLALECR
jgi:hypothetical protein